LCKQQTKKNTKTKKKKKNHTKTKKKTNPSTSEGGIVPGIWIAEEETLADRTK